MEKLSSSISIHPKTKKMIENVHYRVNNSLPVEKTELYDVCPTLFETEIDILESMIKGIDTRQIEFQKFGEIGTCDVMDVESIRTIRCKNYNFLNYPYKL